MKRPQFGANWLEKIEKGDHLLGHIFQAFVMGNALGEFEAKLEVGRHLLTPSLHGLRSRSPVESGISLHRIENRCVLVEKLIRSGIIGKKVAFPLLESPLRKADMVFFDDHPAIFARKSDFDVINKKKNFYDGNFAFIRSQPVLCLNLTVQKRERFHICFPAMLFYIQRWTKWFIQDMPIGMNMALSLTRKR
jgi:hypothetical protein